MGDGTRPVRKAVVGGSERGIIGVELELQWRAQTAGKKKKKARASAYLVNNQGQCAGGKTNGATGCVSRLQPRQVADGDGR